MIDKIKNKIAKDYWIDKLKKGITHNPISPIKFTFSNPIVIDKTQLTTFRKVTNGNYLAEYTIFLANFLALVEQYFHQIDNSKVLLEIEESSIDKTYQLLFQLHEEYEGPLKSLIEATKKELQEAFHYRDIDLNQLIQEVEALDLRHQVSLTFSYLSKGDRAMLGGDFQLNIHKTKNGDYKIWVIYNEAVIPKNLANHFTNTFKSWVNQLHENLQQPIKRIPILDLQERSKILQFSKPNQKVFPSNKSIIDIFMTNVTQTPDKLAVTHGENQYSYEALNQETNKLANYLVKTYGIGKNDVVGIYIPKSDKTLMAILAVLKTGAAFLPIDINYPDHRINHIIKDSSLKILLCTDNRSPFTKDVPHVFIDQVSYENPANLKCQIQPDDLAYVIYTSGSTGNPKGVMVKHTSNVNMSLDQIDLFEIKPEDRVVWFASVAFDASISEIMMALYAGATLIIPEDGVIKDRRKFLDFMKETHPTVITFPPSYLDLLPEESVAQLDCIITAGEPARLEKAVSLSNKLRYYNAYGPTECSVCVTTHQVNSTYQYNGSVPIGKPIANLSVYILDEYLEPRPIGVAGNIFVAGIGLAIGYINNPELTNKRFIENPFEAGTKMYDTGDLGRWLPDGNIEFLGRKDEQVKIRGHRIELQDITNNLFGCSEEISQVCTVVKDHKDDLVIVAYYVAKNKFDPNFLRQELTKRIPEYMLPTFFISLEELPVTPHGKIDKKALISRPLSEQLQKDYKPPSNQVEKKLVAIWQELLGFENIGVTDNFFDLGGHSIKAIQLNLKIQEEFDTSINVKLLFEKPTIEMIAKAIRLQVWSMRSIDESENEELDYNII